MRVIEQLLCLEREVKNIFVSNSKRLIIPSYPRVEADLFDLSFLNDVVQDNQSPPEEGLLFG